MSTSTLLTTKSRIPHRRAGGVTRPRLLARLRAGLNERRKLTLISAPAGYGKTTLAAEWVSQESEHHRPPRAAWLSLDKADNHPVRFLAYWLVALQQLDGGLGQKAQSLLGMPKLPPMTSILDELLNDLAGLEAQAILVMDDYHAITNPEIHEALDYFIAHQPAEIHLAIATREDPPLPLARLRARGQLTEIRAGDLRFTPEEVTQFFSQTMHLDLDPEAIDSLAARTEGWAVGLQLAALALQSHPSRHEFLADFGGSHRYVIDYLAGEVIRQQDEAIRDFLAQTAILDRLNPALCNAVTGRDDGQARLHQLENANLFLMPLDSERQWYRYHHLFAEYLRAGLSKTEEQELQRRASAWHEENDYVLEAVRYAFSSGDLAFAAETIERALQRDAIWSDGRLVRLARWLDFLPPEALQSRPLLALQASRVMYLSGRFEQAEELIDQADRRLRARQSAAPEVERMLAMAALCRGAIAAMRGNLREALEQTTNAEKRLKTDDTLSLARAAYSRGLAYELAGKTERSLEAYLEAGELARSAGVLFLAINARCAAAMVQITQGKLGAAAQTCRRAIDLAGETRIAPLGLALSVLGRIALEQDDLPAAEKQLQDGIELSRQGRLQDDLSQGLAFLARFRFAQRDLPGAIAAQEQANAIIETYQIPRLAVRGSAQMAWLWLAAGQMKSALKWARQYQAARTEKPAEYVRESEDLTLVRILLAHGKIEPARSILNSLFEQAGSGGRQRVCIEVAILQALLHRADGDIPRAVDSLAQALRWASPEGFARVFLDEGVPLLELLPRARPAEPEFVDGLLERRPQAGEARLPMDALLPEPLTDREQEVLRLIAAGKSNREIARELVIGTGTAKWHVHNILQKLGVRNRAQAIARARELGIT